MAANLQALRRRHPLFAEVLLTDRSGRLIAATGKTSDYWQADELWWQKSMKLKPGRAWLEGLHFDESSATFSLDIAAPVTTPEGQVVGALKASLVASPLFSSISRVLAERALQVDIVREDGIVLLRLGATGFLPGSARVDAGALRQLTPRRPGWMVETLFADTASMVGFAKLSIKTDGGDGAGTGGLASMFVVVHQPAAAALSSLRRQVMTLTFAGGALVMGFGGIGFWIAQRKIVAPVRLLRGAAGAVAANVRPSGANPNPLLEREAQEHLQGLAKVDTRDELEALAGDFRLMGERVLSYQRQLEEDIAAKTAAIRQDLDMAREFQEALMPSSYPAVPEGNDGGRLSLFFHHVYRPASSVGGDFFDVLKLSDHQAGVFIADVMGHGARSALITAILRTLLQTYARQAQDPALLLALVNRQFQELTQQTQQTMFVTAFYMVADTLKQTIQCASAGHPSPLLARRSARTVEALIPPPKDNPALGLFHSSEYTTFTRSMEPGDLVVLFTDGVLEAASPAGEEFGAVRLRAGDFEQP